jgi:hypothetical protein
MKKLTLGLTAGITLLALAVVGVRAGQRVRVIDIDNSASPKATTAVNVALTPAVNGTNTTSLTTVVLSNQVATAATQTQVVKAGTTQVALTLNSATLTYVASVDNGTGIMATVSVVTNASVNAVFGFATTTPQVVITNTIAAVDAATNVVVGSSVTNSTGVMTGGYGFTAAQANGILTNVNLLYQMLQP